MSLQRDVGHRSHQRGLSHDHGDAPPKLLPRPLRAQSFHSSNDAQNDTSESIANDASISSFAESPSKLSVISQSSQPSDRRPSIPSKPLHLSQSHAVQQSISIAYSSASTMAASPPPKMSSSSPTSKPQIATRLATTQPSLLESQYQSVSPRKLYPPTSLAISSSEASSSKASPKPMAMQLPIQSVAAPPPPPQMPIKMPVPDFTHHNMNSPLSPRFSRISPVPSFDGFDSSELTLEEDDEADPDTIQAHTLLHTHPFASQQQMNVPNSLNANPRRSHANAPARILGDARMGRVRRNWIQHFMGNFGAISRSSRVLLILSCMVMVSEIVITTFVLLISHSTGEVCDTSLDLYLVVYEVRVLLSLPLVVYQYLHPPLEEAYGHHRTGGQPSSPTPHPATHSRPSLQTSATADSSRTTATSHVSAFASQQSNNRNTNNLSSSNRNPSNNHYRRPPPRANFHVNKELSLLIDRLKSSLDIFSVLWFLAGNYWLLSSNGCYRTAPLLYYLSLAFLGMGYVVVSIPVFMCLGIVFCLPFVLVWTRVLRIGGANSTAGAGNGGGNGNVGGDGRAAEEDDENKPGNPLGLSDAVIRGIPILTFRKTGGKQQRGIEKKRSSGYSDPQLLLALPVTGGVVANGSIAGETAGGGGTGSVGSGNGSGMENRRRGGGAAASPQANVIVEVKDRISVVATERSGSRNQSFTSTSSTELGEPHSGPNLPPRPHASSVGSSNLSSSFISVSTTSKSYDQSTSSYPPRPVSSSMKPPSIRPIPSLPPSSASSSTASESASSPQTSRKGPQIPPRPQLVQSPVASSPRNLSSKPASPKPASSPPPPVQRRPAPHTQVNALELQDGQVDTTLTEEDSVCVICLFGYEDGDRVRKLCVDEWLRCNKTCPLCVQDVTAALTQSV
ncbi:hypothetical protein BJ741DRAFT_662701 [Chytriomyces cf. hyalinus JEL632]|nr:hypothetical protein BJ741DRAFT_662701 [Chytriomyces cf. hyalinus JEL632]